MALKWPNDLYVGRASSPGSSPSRARRARTRTSRSASASTFWARPTALGVPDATTLEDETGKRVALSPLLQALLDRLDRELAAPRWSEEVRAWELASLAPAGRPS